MPIYTKTPNGWEAIAQDAKAVSSFGSIVPDGNQTDEGTYTDADGREWVWYEWATPGNYSASLSGGLYWVLCVGGGDGGADTNSGTNQGQAGNVNEGLWEFTANSSTPITVGDRGGSGVPVYGLPSSIGNYGTQGKSFWGASNAGRGGLVNPSDNTGYKSFITGSEQEYATGGSGSARPGRGGTQGNLPGCVIIATVVNGAKPKPVQPALTPATIVSAPVKVSGDNDVIEWFVKQTDGKRKRIWFLPGNTGLDAGNSNACKPEAVYSVELTNGVLPGVMVGSGGCGGKNSNTIISGGGGAGGVIGLGANTPVILPVQESATYTITVGSTTSNDFQSPVQAQHTTIAVEGGTPFAVAAGGGRGYDGVHNNVGSGASGGGARFPFIYSAWWDGAARGIPGQGHGGNWDAHDNYGGGGGGYSSGEEQTSDGGGGFNLKDSLSLDGTDAPTAAFLDFVTDGGFIAGGGASGTGAGTPGPGGGSTANGGQDFTGGGGGGSTGTTDPGGTGGCGMVLLIEDA